MPLKWRTGRAASREEESSILDYHAFKKLLHFILYKRVYHKAAGKSIFILNKYFIRKYFIENESLP